MCLALAASASSAALSIFLDDVGRRVGAGVHARPLAHGLQALEDAEGGFVVSSASSAYSDRDREDVAGWAAKVPPDR